MIYIEYGLDFDNNRFGLGRSVEIERDNGTEYRTKEKVNNRAATSFKLTATGKTVATELGLN